jgi:hypothetical protein
MPDEPKPRCTYRGCTVPPVVKLHQSIGGAHWFGCPAHYPAMKDALLIGMSGSSSGTTWVEVTPL